MNKQNKELIEIEQYQIKAKKREPEVSKKAILTCTIIVLAVIIGFTIVCLVKFFA